MLPVIQGLKAVAGIVDFCSTVSSAPLTAHLIKINIDGCRPIGLRCTR